LEVFNDSWEALWLCQDVIAELAKLDSGSARDDRAQPDDIRAMLDRLGFEDVTETTNPADARNGRDEEDPEVRRLRDEVEALRRRFRHHLGR
jgi:hypothetical protein